MEICPDYLISRAANSRNLVIFFALKKNGIGLK